MKTIYSLSFALLLGACSANPTASELASSGVADDAAEPECMISGCSGEVCADEELFTTCVVPSPEVLCISSGACERQEGGDCGFTMSPEVEACLAALELGEQWMTYSPTQCGSNPWESEPAPPVSESLAGETAAVYDYLAAQGVEVLELGFLEATEPMAVCASCSCPRGDLLVVRALGQDVSALESLGFARADGLMAHGTVQCGGNPWQEETDPRALQTEEQMVRSWLSDAAVGLSMVGFIVPSEPQITCMACSCSRGDLLVASPIDGSAADDLASLGFGVLD